MPATDRPNIILITTDQQRFDTIHAAGNPYIRTPHLDWLADQGVRFTNCYSDGPLCMAARASIMTGRYNHRNSTAERREACGFHAPIDLDTSLATLLTRAGYQTRAIGKMHFHPTRNHNGFEHMELLEDYYRYMRRHSHLGRPSDHGLGANEMEPTVSTVEESNSLTHWTVDRSVDFIETRDAGRPFFLWTSFAKPHPPFDPCLSYWLMYQNAEVPEPVYGDWSARAEDVPPGFMITTWWLNNCDRFSREQIRDIRRAYYACITQIDYNLGRLIARLRETNQLDNTWIIFTSDHGEMLGDHHMGAKGAFFEGACHVPMLLRPAADAIAPEDKGAVCDSPVVLADVFSTCLGIAGVENPHPDECDGLDLRAVAAGGASRSVIHGQFGSNYVALEMPYKYTYCSAGGAALLFNLEDDPYEQHDLSGDPALGETLERLKRGLVEELRATRPDLLEGGELPLSPEPCEAAIRGRSRGFHTSDDVDSCEVMH